MSETNHTESAANAKIIAEFFPLSSENAAAPRLVEILIRKKVLERYRLLDQYYVVAVDGTGLYSFHQRYCQYWLTFTHQGQTTYYHYVLEAKLITWDGFSLFLMSEFIDNPQANPSKQDCELNAFHRLAARSFNAAATTTGASSSS